jgi:hypothetical protein
MTSEGHMFWRKKRLKKSYSEGLTAIQMSLYAVIVSILQDELSGHYSSEDLKEAAGITVNMLGLRPENRPDPSLSNDKLGTVLSDIKGLTMIKEATSLILLFDYFISDKTDTARYEEAKKIGGPDFETIYNLVDIDRTSANKIRSIAAAMSNRLHEISSFDIRNAL